MFEIKRTILYFRAQYTGLDLILESRLITPWQAFVFILQEFYSVCTFSLLKMTKTHPQKYFNILENNLAVFKPIMVQIREFVRQESMQKYSTQHFKNLKVQKEE